MKRLASIFFLVLFLFNVGGYYIVFWAMGVQVTNELLSRLDADNYSSDDAIVLSLPLSMPYPVPTDDYMRVNGDFSYNGDHYRLVKQKVENDTLFIVCVRDHESTKLANALNEYTKAANNLPAGTKQALTFLGKLYKDFNTTEFSLYYESRLLFEKTFYASFSPSVLTREHVVESPPPRKYARAYIG
ncbi:MAG TPA: hypothetical protein VKZ68_03475 [Ohtaekwangia sp.]|nr:hypothetical protein [Ohtaekwangia sp.]